MKQRALIIGVSDYEELGQLSFCKNDGNSMYETLHNAGYYISDNNKLVGTVDWVTMRKAIMDFFDDSSISPDDILIFYYSGHGVPDIDGDVYLATSEIEPASPYRNGFSFSELIKMARRTIATRVVVILDCCYSGSANLGKGYGDDAARLGSAYVDNRFKTIASGEGICLLSASQAYQEAYALVEKDHSLFTYYLLLGLGGKDREVFDRHGNITVDTLSNYVYDKIMRLPFEKKPKQKPLRKIESSGDIILVDSGRRNLVKKGGQEKLPYSDLTSEEKRRIIDELIQNCGHLQSHEDVLKKIVIPFLKKLGYEEKEMTFDEWITARVGTKKVNGKADIVIRLNSQPVICVDGKAWLETLSEEHELQVISYAKLISTPPAPIAVLSNGRDWEVYDIIKGDISNEVPTHNEMLQKLQSTEIPRLSSSEADEAKRIFHTLIKKDELMSVFEKCYKIMSSQEGLIFDRAFHEMSKIIACKMTEEKRVVGGKNHYRFTVDFLKDEAKRWRNPITEILNNMFREAMDQFPILFPKGTKIELKYDNTIEQIVGLLEPFALYGTGEDIKGAVYEIFLKETLRGPLGQYFTPRQIVDFIIELVKPKIGDRIIDPAAGSGGFLIRSFITLNRKIEHNFGGDTRERYKKELIENGLWGIEIDPSLAMLCKLNLILHGDGYNHIYDQDALGEVRELAAGKEFELVLTNPPFSLPNENPLILERYDLGKSRRSQMSDVLYLERCIKLAKPGGRIAIIIPEGFLNNPSDQTIRDYIFENTNIRAVIGLPWGAFRPFGGSAAKTCILYLQRKKSRDDVQGPVFMANTEFIGYNPRTKAYKLLERNDLQEILRTQEYQNFQQIEQKQNGV